MTPEELAVEWSRLRSLELSKACPACGRRNNWSRCIPSRRFEHPSCHAGIILTAILIAAAWKKGNECRPSTTSN